MAQNNKSKINIPDRNIYLLEKIVEKLNVLGTNLDYIKNNQQVLERKLYKSKSWLSKVPTKEEMQLLIKKIDQKLREIEDQTQRLLNQVQERIDNVEKIIEGLESQLNMIKELLEKI